jgi:hypothetical protein
MICSHVSYVIEVKYVSAFSLLFVNVCLFKMCVI